MRGLSLFLVAALVVATPTLARDSLFGRSPGAASSSQAGSESRPAPTAPSKPKADGAAAAPSPRKDQAGAADQAHGSSDRAKDGSADPSVEDIGVIIRPLKLDDGVTPRERLDFQLSRIDKPFARETSATFREAWAAFRQQNRIADDRASFQRSPQTPSVIKARLLQHLGDGRWLADAEWSNSGQFSWCPAGLSADKAVLVLAVGEGKVGDALETNAVHVGKVELRFDCEVPPAEGRRITIRREAFLSLPPLPDDEPTRALFQQIVADGKSPPEAIVLQVRDCKSCRGVGYIRRAVPGKIQDAHDPCPEACDRGRQRVPVLVTFRP